MRGAKKPIAVARSARAKKAKTPKLKKMKSKSWYQRTAGAMSIRRDQVPSPSIVPGDPNLEFAKRMSPEPTVQLTFVTFLRRSFTLFRRRLTPSLSWCPFRPRCLAIAQRE